MKYSLRSLMIVVTLAASGLGLFARSRDCARQAAFHREQLPPEFPYCGTSEVKYPGEDWLRFHEESAVALERVSSMPWLPLLLPPAPAPVDAEKELEKQRALDELRTRLAKEAREKYGVP